MRSVPRLLLCLLSTSAAADPGFENLALNGLYPLWENTGRVLEHRGFVGGTGYVQVGLFDRFQIGVRPVSFAFRSPNGHFKVRLLNTPALQVSAQVEGVVLLPGAAETFTSSNYVSRLDNALGLLVVVPVGLATTWKVNDVFSISATATVMGVVGARAQGTLTLGLWAVGELTAIKHHALLVHVGEVGFWRHDFFAVGASYRFSYGWFEGRFGYVYRLTRDGGQGSPLFSIGVQL